MNMSLRRQLMVCFMGLMAMMFLANYLVNTFFLESYYYMRKKEVLVGAYDILNEAPGSSTASDSERMEELTNICLANGVSLLVIDQDNYVRLRTIWTGDDQIRLMRARLNGYQMGIDVDDVSIRMIIRSRGGMTRKPARNFLRCGAFWIPVIPS